MIISRAEYLPFGFVSPLYIEIVLRSKMFSSFRVCTAEIQYIVPSQHIHINYGSVTSQFLTVRKEQRLLRTDGEAQKNIITNNNQINNSLLRALLIVTGLSNSNSGIYLRIKQALVC